MKVLSLSLTAIVLAFSSAVSASDFEEDKQYIACRKSASTDRQLIACQERLLERLNILNFSGLLTLKSVTPTLTLAF